MYYPIDEQTARRAHIMNSMSDYEEGSTTRDYKTMVDQAAEIAEAQKAAAPELAEEIDVLLDRYSKRLAEWYNKRSRIEAMCPSVLVSGRSNFPVAKKEKQNSARDKSWQEYEELKEFKGKGRYAARIIKSDSENAIERLTEKIAKLEEERERVKAANAEARKNGGEQSAWYVLPYIGRDIKAAQDRIDSLTKIKETGTEEKETEIEGLRVVMNADLVRIQLLFDEKPSEDVRNILKSNGFKWAPSQNAWQRQLTANGRYATKCVLRELAKIN